MNRYPSYKPTGVKWPGEIPSHWEMLPGLAIFKENKEKNSNLAVNTVLSLSYGKIVVKKDIDEGLVPAEYNTYQIVHPGYIIIRCTDLQNDKVSLRTGLVKDDGIITGAYLGLVTSGKYNSSYMHYFLHAWDITKEIYRHGNGLRQSLSWLDLRRLPILIPPIAEQTAIANYLDTATAKIDAAIAQQQKMIDLLNERKQIIINRAVTKGLNPNAKMKDSGVEWIGEVPEGWEVRRMGSLGEFSKGGNISRDDLQEYGKCAILYGDIYTKYNIQTAIVRNHISEKVAEKSVRISKGDILMTSSGETKEDIGKTIVYLGNEEAFIGGDVILFRQQNNDSTFLSYALNSQYAKDYRYKESKGEIIVHIYASSLKRLYLALPPIEEQIKVVNYLDGQIDAIDNEIEVINKQISLLQERKQIIINEVVTGKVKVG